MANDPQIPDQSQGIEVLNPQGQRGTIPSEQVGDALKNGYKLTKHTLMYDSSGTPGLVPNEQLRDAIKAGYQTTPETQFEKDRAGAFQSTARDPRAQVGELIKNVVTNPRQLLSNAYEAGKGLVEGIGETATNIPGGPAGLIAAGKAGAQIGQEDLARKQAGRSALYRGTAAVGSALGVPVAQMEREADIGQPAGVVGAGVPLAAATVAPAALKFISEATAPARARLAQRFVEPVVRRPVTQTMENMRTGIDPARAIVREGLVGTKAGMETQAGARTAELKNAADNILQSSPNNRQLIDVNPIIDQSIDKAQAAARQLGSDARVSRLETLRQALHTEYGPTSGTPFEMNELKSKIGERAFGVGAYKGVEPVEESVAGALSDVYTGIKNAVNQSVPEAAPLNERMADAIQAESSMFRNRAAETGQSLQTVSPTKRAAGIVLSAPVRSGAARLISLGNKLPIPETTPPLPRFIGRGGPVVGPGGQTAPFGTGGGGAPMVTPPQTPVAPGPGSVNTANVTPESPLWTPAEQNPPFQMKPGGMWPPAPETPPTPQPPSTVAGPTPGSLSPGGVYRPPGGAYPITPQRGPVVPPTQPPVPSEGAPPPAVPSAPSGTTAASPSGGQPVPPTFPQISETPAPLNPQELADFTQELRRQGYKGPITADNIYQLMRQANEIRSATAGRQGPQ